MALYYITRSIFHVARLLYVRPETFESYHVYSDVRNKLIVQRDWRFAGHIHSLLYFDIFLLP